MEVSVHIRFAPEALWICVDTAEGLSRVVVRKISLHSGTPTTTVQLVPCLL